ncbi:MAG TPA: hypothetical protein VJI97_01710 [Candidatus Nanoarchaeia archaeon]|nr:hypothetical protein [Candidatus Nanoarchaeia archaeon]
MDFSSLILSAKDFLFDRQFLNLLVSTIVLFIVSLVSWHVYSNQLAKRDLFQIKIKPNASKIRFFDRFVYLMKYLILFPVYSFLWFLLFSFLLFLLSRARPIEDILFFGIVVVAATRLGAYVSERLAEDMAKLLPWSLILVFLIDPQAITLKGVLDSFLIFLQQIPRVLKYLLFIVALEWILRIGYWIIKPKNTKQQQ